MIRIAKLIKKSSRHGLPDRLWPESPCPRLRWLAEPPKPEPPAPVRYSVARIRRAIGVDKKVIFRMASLGLLGLSDGPIDRKYHRASRSASEAALAAFLARHRDILESVERGDTCFGPRDEILTRRARAILAKKRRVR